MSLSEAWAFEHPTNVTANFPVSISWEPNTFSADKLGSFTLNLWLLRADSATDAQIILYADVLLARDQSVFNNTVLWTPNNADVDIGVAHAGTHQLAWEETQDNPNVIAANTSLRGFSRGFNVLPDDSSVTLTSTATLSTLSTYSTSSTSSSSSSSSPTSSGTPAVTTFLTPTTTSSSVGISKAESQTSTTQPMIIGLSIGFGVLLLACIIGGVWIVRMIRRKRATAQRTEEPLPRIWYPEETQQVVAQTKRGELYSDRSFSIAELPGMDRR